jgi:hypothetical protein
LASFVYTGILIVSVLFLVRKRMDVETYFPLKIFGYFILGSFAFHMNEISLPLGFAVYLLLFHPKLNAQIKRKAAFLGFLSFILVHWLLPFAIDGWNSRAIHIDREIGSVYEANFQEEWELVRKDLKLDNVHLRLKDFQLEYAENGSLRDLNWELIGPIDNTFQIYYVRYNYENGWYSVTRNQVDNWLQYDQLIDTDVFFEHLNLLDIQKITMDKGHYPYYVIRSRGERVTYGDSKDTLFMIDNGEIKEFYKEQFPVDAYNITTFAMKKTGEQRDKQGNMVGESYEGTEVSDYLIQVHFVEE